MVFAVSPGNRPVFTAVTHCPGTDFLGATMGSLDFLEGGTRTGGPPGGGGRVWYLLPTNQDRGCQIWHSTKATVGSSVGSMGEGLKS